MSDTEHRDFLADLRRTDVRVPRVTLKDIRAVLTTTPLARWEIADQRVAMVNTIDYLLNQENP